MFQPVLPTSVDDVRLDELEFWDSPDEEREGAFALLRRERPMSFHEEFELPPEIPLPRGPGYWAVTRHADVIEASRRSDLFCSGKGIQIPDLPEEMNEFFGSMIAMDDPRHARLRRIVSRGFTPRSLGKIDADVQKRAVAVVDRVIEKGECDFVEEVAAILPLWVICEMMGVPEEDRRRVYEIGNGLIASDDPEMQDDGKPRDRENTSAQEAFAEMFMYADKLLEKARTNPSDDIATALVNAELDGHKLSDDEFRFFFLLLLIAGNETTRTVTTNGMITLLEHPDQLAAVESDPGLVDSAVEEMLRFAPAVHTFRRQATTDIELRDRTIRENDKVTLWYSSVNRDEEVFADPDSFNVRRHPNDHLAFGVGEHYCLGANLARLELREIFRGIVTRFRDMEMTAPPRRLRSTFINGVKEMRVRFRPGAAQA
jgi:cytochrome P450